MAGNMSLSAPALAKRELTMQFATPLMTRKYSGVDMLNATLGELLLRLEKEMHNNAPRTTNLGGFHTGAKLFNRNEPALAELREMIQDSVLDYIDEFVRSNCSQTPEELKMRLWGWGIVMRAGDINHLHVHPDAKVSGVYYVAVPKSIRPVTNENPEGAIMFADPRPRAHMNRIQHQITENLVAPEAGMLIVFPAYYEHAVIPFRGRGHRICIAFNARF